jgi:precorrin-2 dehydrogenase/sirohydrochlorin ferrochelatase
MSSYLPINLNIEHKRCVVVGGGVVAQRKVETLLRFEAKVEVVSPKLTPQLEKLAQDGQISYCPREYSFSDLKGAYLVIAATDDAEMNNLVSQEAASYKVLVNVVNSEKDSTFIFPAILKRGDLVISTTTCGKSPALARKIKQELEQTYGEEYEQYLALLGKFRAELKNIIPDPERRKKAWDKLLSSELLELIREGREDLAEERIKQCLLSS